jgi:methionyl-tRNA formyltransferase
LVIVIINIIKKDNILFVEPLINTEIQLKPQIIKCYRVEDITCSYLKNRFQEFLPGSIVYEYSDKILVKTREGVIKIYHIHISVEKEK